MLIGKKADRNSAGMMSKGAGREEKKTKKQKKLNVMVGGGLALTMFSANEQSYRRGRR